MSGGLHLQQQHLHNFSSIDRRLIRLHLQPKFVLVVATKEIGLSVNADKTKYMVVSRDRNAGRGHSVKIDNSSIERV